MTTVGEILKKTRLEKNIDLNKVEKILKIRKKFLQAIEENNWSVFPSQVYIEGVISIYGQFLNLPITKLKAYFRRDYYKNEDLNNPLKRKNLDRSFLIPESKKIFYLGTVIVFLSFVGYFVIQIFRFLSPPRIKIISPTESKFYNEKEIIFRGKVDRDSQIIIFGEKIFPDKNGNFSYRIPLKKGLNKVVIEVIGSNGKKTQVIKELINL